MPRHAVRLEWSAEPDDVAKFAQQHQLILMGRPELKKWAHGQHLYDVLGIPSTTQ